MKILQVIASADPKSGGVIEGVLQTSSSFVAMGHQVTIACADDRGSRWLESLPIQTYALGSIKWLRGFSIGLIAWLVKHIREYDFIIVNGLWNSATLAASIALRKRGAPYAVFPHGMMDPWFRHQYPLKHWLKQISWLVSEGPLLSGAKAVLFTSEDELVRSKKEFLGYKYKSNVVGYGIGDPAGSIDNQKAAFLKAMPELVDRPFLLFLSRIHAKKGIDILLDAFGALSPIPDNLRLVVAGPDQVGMKEELLTRCEVLGIKNKVHWPGMLTGQAKWGAYRLAEAFILPSHQENFGIVVAEAMACATPVLITNKVNIWREVEKSGAGLVENDDAAGIELLIRRFMALSSDQRALMGSSARECFEENFDVEHVSQSLIELMSNVVLKR